MWGLYYLVFISLFNSSLNNLNAQQQVLPTKGKAPYEYCISPSDKDGLDYVEKPQCFKEQTFSDIKSKKPRIYVDKNIPSCSEFAVLLHRMNHDSETLSYDDFSKKYDEINDPVKNILYLQHPLFKDIHSEAQNGILASSDIAMLDVLAYETKKQLTHDLQENITKYGLVEAKAILKKSVGIGIHTLPLAGESAEEILKELTVESIKNSFLKQLVSTPVAITHSFDHIYLYAQNVSKTWIKESLNIIKNSKGVAVKEVLKNTLSALRIKITPNLAMNIVAVSYSLFTSPNDYEIFTSKEEQSLLHQPQLFSAFATNSNFKYAGYNCDDLFKKFCSYYYWKACESKPTARSFIQHGLLKNYFELRKEIPRKKEAIALKEKDKYQMKIDNTNVVRPLPLKVKPK